MKMLRGCQRKVYYMKNTGSSVFDEAYLIIRNDYSDDGTCSNLAEEAERIIKESSDIFKKKRKKSIVARRAAIFALGAASSSAIIGIVSLLIALA